MKIGKFTAKIQVPKRNEMLRLTHNFTSVIKKKQEIVSHFQLDLFHIFS